MTVWGSSSGAREGRSGTEEWTRIDNAVASLNGGYRHKARRSYDQTVATSFNSTQAKWDYTHNPQLISAFSFHTGDETDQGWYDMINGVYDSSIRSFVRSVPSGHKMYYVFHHEPENNGSNPQTLWRQAWARFAKVVLDEGNSNVIPTFNLMSYTWRNRNPDDYNPARHMTAEEVAACVGTVDGYAADDPTTRTPSWVFGPAYDDIMAWGFRGFGIMECGCHTGFSSSVRATWALQLETWVAARPKVEIVCWWSAGQATTDSVWLDGSPSGTDPGMLQTWADIIGRNQGASIPVTTPPDTVLPPSSSTGNPTGTPVVGSGNTGGYVSNSMLSPALGPASEWSVPEPIRISQREPYYGDTIDESAKTKLYPSGDTCVAVYRCKRNTDSQAGPFDGDWAATMIVKFAWGDYGGAAITSEGAVSSGAILQRGVLSTDKGDDSANSGFDGGIFGSGAYGVYVHGAYRNTAPLHFAEIFLFNLNTLQLIDLHTVGFYPEGIITVIKISESSFYLFGYDEDIEGVIYLVSFDNDGTLSSQKISVPDFIYPTSQQYDSFAWDAATGYGAAIGFLEGRPFHLSGTTFTWQAARAPLFSPSKADWFQGSEYPFRQNSRSTTTLSEGQWLDFAFSDRYVGAEGVKLVYEGSGYGGLVLDGGPVGYQQESVLYTDGYYYNQWGWAAANRVIGMNGWGGSNFLLSYENSFGVFESLFIFDAFGEHVVLQIPLDRDITKQAVPPPYNTEWYYLTSQLCDWQASSSGHLYYSDIVWGYYYNYDEVTNVQDDDFLVQLVWLIGRPGEYPNLDGELTEKRQKFARGPTDYTA